MTFLPERVKFVEYGNLTCVLKVCNEIRFAFREANNNNNTSAMDVRVTNSNSYYMSEMPQAPIHHIHHQPQRALLHNPTQPRPHYRLALWMFGILCAMNTCNKLTSFNFWLLICKYKNEGREKLYKYSLIKSVLSRSGICVGGQMVNY